MRLILRPLLIASMFFIGCSSEDAGGERTEAAAEALSACITQAPDLTYSGQQLLRDVPASAAKPPCGAYIVALERNDWRAAVVPTSGPTDEATCVSLTISADVVGYSPARDRWMGVGSVTGRGVWTASDWDGGPDRYCAVPELKPHPGPASFVNQRLFIQAQDANGPSKFELLITP
jgi:hypothetical protein